jgi:V8-like Glu-specific endopeptidase
MKGTIMKTTISLGSFRHRQVNAVLAFTALGLALTGQAIAQVSHVGSFTVYNVPTGARAPSSPDFVKAKALQLPIGNVPADQTQAMISAIMSPASLGTPGHSNGVEGTGAQSSTFLGTPDSAGSSGGFSSQAYGTNNHPFSTATADLNGFATNTKYPYSAAGKLFFKIGTSSYICSASMIKRGIAVTAAHCVANYGASQFYNSWQFVPGYRLGAAPYGVATVKQVWIKSAYFNGTDACFQYGVICPDDVAVLILNPNAAGGYVGASTGWYGYGWDGYGFVNNQTHITQIGYPAGLDNAALMERNDSSGFVNVTYSRNTIIGSNMDGGSSGGPWLVNFGTPPALTGETAGSAANPNVVVGVTSWGYTSTAPKEQGAAPFTTNNIVSLVNSACAATPAACI